VGCGENRQIAYPQPHNLSLTKRAREKKGETLDEIGLAWPRAWPIGLVWVGSWEGVSSSDGWGQWAEGVGTPSDARPPAQNSALSTRPRAISDLSVPALGHCSRLDARPCARRRARPLGKRPGGAILVLGSDVPHAGASIAGQVLVRAGERNLSVKLVLGTSSNQRLIVAQRV